MGIYPLTLIFLIAASCDLFELINCDDLKLVSQMLGVGDSKFEINAMDEWGCTPICYAQSDCMVQLLVSHGAVTDCNGNGDPIFELVSLFNDSPDLKGIVRELKANGLKVGPEEALSIRDYELFENLLSDSDFESQKLNSLLVSAVQSQSIEATVILLNRSADPNVCNSMGSPLITTVSKRPDLMRLLLEHGADPDSSIPQNLAKRLEGVGGSGTEWVHNENGQILLDPPIEGWSPLHFAAHEGILDGAKLLIEFGANINAEDKLGNSPLHIGAKACLKCEDDEDLEPSCEKRAEVLLYLVRNGAILNTRNFAGITAKELILSDETPKKVLDIIRPFISK